jgi:2-polyprenyl-3-methyl-5-hydroxy-6-metoxy-1,4-benzoquinol methylase/glycosyltransferase involved in cell wall biosynthesis
MRIAYFSPLNPQPSGISDYSEELLPYLAEHVEIDLFVDGFWPSNRELVSRFRVFDYQRDPSTLAALDGYDAIVYHVGNDHRYHTQIVEIMRSNPGVAVFHDFALQDFFLGLARQAGNDQIYLDEMMACHGSEAQREAEVALARRGTPSAVALPTDFPLNSRLARGSEAIIVHSEWSRSRFAKIAPGVPLTRIDMPVRRPREQATSTTTRDHVSIATFGLITPGKGIERTLRALGALKAHHHFRYTLVGAPNPYFDIGALIRESGLSDRVEITGHVPLEEFERWIEQTDVAVNLRDRTVGETSASLCRIMTAGVAAIVSNVGWYAEIPGDCVARIDLDQHGDEVLLAFLKRLIEDADLRRTIGANARQHAIVNHNLERAAQGYVTFIRDVIADRARRRLLNSVSNEMSVLGVREGDENLMRVVAGDVALLSRSTFKTRDVSGNGDSKRKEEYSASPSPSGRTGKIEGIDYKRAAREYVDKLSDERRHHLLTKPFYNLAHKLARYKNEGLDEDSHRHLCDFANMAVALALPPGSRILDVGCGSGWLAEYFARLGYHLKGIDISESLIQMARERLARVPFPVDPSTPLRCEFQAHDIEESALDEKFDAIICYDSLHHFEDERAVFRHLAAMLDIGGQLFILEGERPPAGSASEDWLRSVMREFATLESPFTTDYLLELLDQNGLAVVGDYIGVNGLFERELLARDALPLDGMETAFNYLLCKKVAQGSRASTVPDSRRPNSLKATLRILDPVPMTTSRGEEFELRLMATNTGDTLWRTGQTVRAGVVMPGVRVFDETGKLISERHGPLLSRAVAPSESITTRVKCEAPPHAGKYKLKLDLLDQHISWFEDRGSKAIVLDLEVIG